MSNSKRLPWQKEDPQKFTEEFRILINAYDPGIPDLSQLIYILVGPEKKSENGLERQSGWNLKRKPETLDELVNGPGFLKGHSQNISIKAKLDSCSTF